MTNATKTKHTTIYVVTGPAVASKILAVRQAGVPDAAASDIDVSHWDDDFDQFVAGRKATGETSMEVIYDATDHDAIEALYQSGALTQFLVLAPASETAAAAAPTVTASAFAPVTTVDNIKFSGYVKNFALQMQDNDVWRATITIKGSGPRTVTKGA
ncbi:phage tail tube protein [Thermomonas sp.]